MKKWIRVAEIEVHNGDGTVDPWDLHYEDDGSVNKVQKAFAGTRRHRHAVMIWDENEGWVMTEMSRRRLDRNRNQTTYSSERAAHAEANRLLKNNREYKWWDYTNTLESDTVIDKNTFPSPLSSLFEDETETRTDKEVGEDS